MKLVTELVTKKQGFNLHIIPSEKFKTISFVVKFKAPLSKDTISKRALLPYVLRKGTKNYPTEQKLQLKLDNLYGAVLSMDGAKKGNNHIISIRLEIANDKFIQNESSLIDEATTLLREIIFSPNASGNKFNEAIFHRERDILIQKINALIDDKMRYANTRLIDEMCEDEVYGLRVQGYEQDLKSLTAESLYAYYQTLLLEDEIDLYVLGDVEPSSIEDNIALLPFENSTSNTQHTEQKKDKEIKIDKPQTVIEKQDVQQANLQLGYRTNCTFQDEQYFALQVFNGLFGGFPNSKLFINVREKNSLAYYAASRVESHKGLLLVLSGIDIKDYKQAREIIELQMTAMKNGDFTDDEINETKELIVNQLLETLDNPQGIIELLYQQVAANTILPPEELIEGIKQVTKEDILQVADRIEEDTVYLLTNEGGQTDE